MIRILRNRTVLALLALVLVLSALVILSGDATMSHFSYKLF